MIRGNCELQEAARNFPLARYLRTEHPLYVVTTPIPAGGKVAPGNAMEKMIAPSAQAQSIMAASICARTTNRHVSLGSFSEAGQQQLWGNEYGNVHNEIPCRKQANGYGVCDISQLVKYCSKQFQDADWAHHKKDCYSELLQATWTTEYMNKMPKPSQQTETSKGRTTDENQAENKSQSAAITAIPKETGFLKRPKVSATCPGTVAATISTSTKSDGSARHASFLWGNVPAQDLLNMASNESISWIKNLRILFAASAI
ncbi:hypothetical protein BDZ45DRAFT_724141 [Acephala macrosclerotiorum]|nr:hypothetical protein BDZ45DRAFT_724141 [Acephala macrosclerotiorum]